MAKIFLVAIPLIISSLSASDLLSEHNPILTDGSEVSLEGGDFKLTPPVGWESYEGVEGTSLILRAPQGEEKRYRRMMQIQTMENGHYMDEFSANKFAKVIHNKFKESSPMISEYQVISVQPIEFEFDAVLYYATFTINMFDMMQLHVLYSTHDKHYLLTYTDLAEHFEKDQDQFLNEAWSVIETVKLSSAPPSRMGEAFWYGFFGFVLISLVWGYRRWTFSKALVDYTKGEFEQKSIQISSKSKAQKISDDHEDEGYAYNDDEYSDDDSSDDYEDDHAYDKAG